MTAQVSGRPTDGRRPSWRRTRRWPWRLTTRRAGAGRVLAMRTWTAQTTMKGRPEDVLAVLTDPASAGRWAPVDFEVEGLDAPRLEAGTSARISGRLAGKRVGFDVDVHQAGPD